MVLNNQIIFSKFLRKVICKYNLEIKLMTASNLISSNSYQFDVSKFYIKLRLKIVNNF
jgi:hypothetical protein